MDINYCIRYKCKNCKKRLECDIKDNLKDILERKDLLKPAKLILKHRSHCKD